MKFIILIAMLSVFSFAEFIPDKPVTLATATEDSLRDVIAVRLYFKFLESPGKIGIDSLAFMAYGAADIFINERRKHVGK